MTIEPTGRHRLPPLARILGFAGLLPQAAAVVVLLAGDADQQTAALGLAYAYAALIFSFLGGVWWGLAAATGVKAPKWVWTASVVPSLLALATSVVWAAGSDPAVSLVVLGVFIAASVLVDLKLKAAGLTPEGWLALRAPLSIGLGVLTLVAGLI